MMWLVELDAGSGVTCGDRGGSEKGLSRTSQKGALGKALSAYRRQLSSILVRIDHPAWGGPRSSAPLPPPGLTSSRRRDPHDDTGGVGRGKATMKLESRRKRPRRGGLGVSKARGREGEEAGEGNRRRLAHRCRPKNQEETHEVACSYVASTKPGVWFSFLGFAPIPFLALPSRSNHPGRIPGRPLPTSTSAH
ncbi:hypothetical protein B296_00053040 [Ensete ventricosum]|uniref:Uncharacterized protein n=1 Tax=Ensete ventricosum TaxID=4639 RepID=A0A426XU91_ENSVE|nr:hypothetical protein B296_00053040 [Ensete ventricosum]